MIADLRPYAEYKESGLPWLGLVPRYWEVKRAKSIFQRIDERSTTGKEELLTVSSARGIVPRKTANVTMFKAESYLGYKLCWPGDLVINSLWAWAGGLGVSRHHGIISSAYGVYRIRQDAPMTSAFVHEVVRSSSFNWELRVRSKGVWISRLQLTDISFLDAPMQIPPPDEQAAIVRFLDWASGRLERAIRAKRKVIALLNEQKQAIIHRAVTRGLDSSVALSADTGPFLQNLPAHWPVFRAKLLFRQVVPLIPPGAEMVTCFRDGEVTLRRNRRTTGFTNAIWELGYQGVLPGQLVLHSMDAFAGAIGVSDSSGKCSPEYVICEPAMESVLPNYYAHLMRSLALRGLFVALCPSVRERAPRVRFNDFGSFVLPKPPESEQQQIVDSIGKACGRIDASLATVRREAALLYEYRTRLVADVVTGKLDAREAAAQLPEESAPDTAEEDTDLSIETEAADEEGVV